MTPGQKASAIRTAIQTIGGVIGGIFAYKGWASAEQMDSIMNSDLMISLVGWIVSLAAGISGQKAHTEAGAVTAVDELAKTPKSPVKGVILADTPSGRALEKITSPAVVLAGTPQAAAIAR